MPALRIAARSLFCSGKSSRRTRSVTLTDWCRCDGKRLTWDRTRFSTRAVGSRLQPHPVAPPPKDGVVFYQINYFGRRYREHLCPRPLSKELLLDYSRRVAASSRLSTLLCGVPLVAVIDALPGAVTSRHFAERDDRVMPRRIAVRADLRLSIAAQARDQPGTQHHRDRASARCECPQRLPPSTARAIEQPWSTAAAFARRWSRRSALQAADARLPTESLP